MATPPAKSRRSQQFKINHTQSGLKRQPESAGRGKLWLALFFLIASAVLAYFLFGFWQNGGGSLSALFSRTTATPTVIPTPVPVCSETLLEIADRRFQVQSLERSEDASFEVPEGNPGAAYWLQGSAPHYAFALSPSAENQSLAGQLEAGQEVAIRWGDCNRTVYVVQSVEMGAPDTEAVFSRQSSGFTLLMYPAGDLPGFNLVAGMPALPPEPAVEPAEGELLVNLSILDDQISADGSSFTMQISIENLGASPIVLTREDFSVAFSEGRSLPPIAVNPALPVEIAPQTERTLEVTFPHQGTSTTSVQILGFVFDYYY